MRKGWVSAPQIGKAADATVATANGTPSHHSHALLTLLLHLRLPFQLLLAPIFLWGWLLAGGGLNGTLVLAFVSFHVFLYGGATAFNSYYDRDVGPVGGMARPPKVVAALLPFSLAVKGIGWLLAGFVYLPFFLIYGAFATLSLAYSHPRVRLKAHPIGSLLVVGVGQGVLAFLGAWAASRGEIASVSSWPGIGGALAATFLVLGLYPLTQLYQIEEDRARGDRSLAVVWGPPACFGWALVCQAAGGLTMLSVIASTYGWLEACLLGVGLLGQLVAVVVWARSFDARRLLWNYRRAMRLNTLVAGGLSVYLAYRLLAR